MEAAGAATVALNPATTPKLVKALAAVAAAERVDVDDAGLVAIAAAAEGDVRCALASLQMFAAGRSGAHGGRARAEDRTKTGSRKRKAPAAARRGAAGTEGDDDIKKTHPRDAAAAEAARRDRGLSVFHALGKILYNKRDDDSDVSDVNGEDATDANGNVDPSAPFSSGVPARGADGALWFGNAVPAFPLHATFRRARTKYASPETILARARFGADRATTFLFENFPEGLRDDAAEDAAAGAAYLSDAAWFASAGRALAVAGFAFGGGGFADANANGTLTDGNGAPADPGAVGELVAGSVATRGLLFAPHPSRPPLRGFRAFKGPQSAKAHRAAVANLREVRAVVAAAAGGDFSVGSDRVAAAAETLPMLRVIAGAGAEGAERVPYLPTRWVRAGEDPAAAGGVGGLPPGARCAPRPGERTLNSGLDRARAGDKDEEEQEDIEDADDF
jgi:cell cycle checkpoint protein